MDSGVFALDIATYTVSLFHNRPEKERVAKLSAAAAR